MAVYQREYFKQAIGKKPWFYCFRYRKQKFVQSGFLTKAEAQLAEERVRKTVILDNKPVTVATNYTFEQFFNQFIENRQFTNAPGTVEREKRRVKPMIQAFGSVKMVRITAGDIHGYVRMRKKDGLENRSVNLELTLLRSIFKYALEIMATVNNPVKDVKNLHETRKKVFVPTHKEFLKFIQVASEIPNGDQFVIWLWFRAYSGTRPSESYAVKWSNIDFNNDVIAVESRKGRQDEEIKTRLVDIHPNLKPILLEWRQKWEKAFEKKGRIHDYVFFNAHTRKKMSCGFGKIFREVREKAGLKSLTSHGLRHYFISHALMSRVPKDTIREWVGHTSTKMIDTTYGHLQREFQREQMSKFAFYQPKEPEASAENGGANAVNPQSQKPSGSPEEAPKPKTDDGNDNAKLTATA